jgi:microcystin-dependent protein
MSTPFLGEIQIFAFDYAPRTWALCNGQILSIAQNQALFSLLGTTYGGNGTQTFALPDLRSRVPVHNGPINPLGTSSGQEAHTLLITELPSHAHTHSASSSTGAIVIATNNAFASSSVNDYAAQNNQAAMPSLTSSGGSQPHNNLQPYLTLNFCIALNGIYPSRN